MKKLLLLLIIPLLSFGQKVEKTYYENGNLQSQIIYNTDMCEELHKDYYANGQLIFEGCYAWGGSVYEKEWYENGNIKRRLWSEFVKSAETVLFYEKTWYINGQEKSLEEGYDDIGHVYYAVYWDENGNITLEQTYDEPGQ